MTQKKGGKGKRERVGSGTHGYRTRGLVCSKYSDYLEV